jgi:hypothetical protein
MIGNTRARMDNHESTAVAITTIVSFAAIATKLLDLASAWVKYKTQLVQAPSAAGVTTTERSVPSSRIVLRLLLGVWPALLCGLSFLGILFWYAWWPRVVTTGAVVNIALSVGGLLAVTGFIVFVVVVGFRMQVKHDRGG